MNLRKKVVVQKTWILFQKKNVFIASGLKKGSINKRLLEFLVKIEILSDRTSKKRVFFFETIYTTTFFLRFIYSIFVKTHEYQ